MHKMFLKIADIADPEDAIYATKDLLKSTEFVKNVLKIVTDVIQEDATIGVVL